MGNGFLPAVRDRDRDDDDNVSQAESAQSGQSANSGTSALSGNSAAGSVSSKAVTQNPNVWLNNATAAYNQRFFGPQPQVEVVVPDDLGPFYGLKE